MPEIPTYSSAHALTASMHGAVCLVEADYTPFIKFARSYFDELLLFGSASRPNVTARLHWGDPPPLLWSNGAVRERGRRLFQAGERILQTEIAPLKGLQIETYWSSAGLNVDAYYQPSRLDRLVGGFLKSREAVYTVLSYYLVYFPLISYLYHKRGLHLVHAGAVSLPGGARILAGLPGSGKSTLSLALLSHPGARLLSENLLLIDSDHIYACPEPVHLSADSRALIPADARGLLTDAGRDYSHGRRDYQVFSAARDAQASPRSLFLIGLGQSLETVKIEPTEALERLLAFDAMAREISAFSHFNAAISLPLPSPKGFPRKRGALKALLARLDCYELWAVKGHNMNDALQVVLAN